MNKLGLITVQAMTTTLIKKITAYIKQRDTAPLFMAKNMLFYEIFIPTLPRFV